MMVSPMILSFVKRFETHQYYTIIRQFTVYVMVGGLATLVDWSSFYSLTMVAKSHYYPALATSTFLGTLTHYALNRLFTFKQTACTSKKQLGIYIAIVGLSFGLNFVWMTFFITALHLHVMISRVITTGLMLFINFALHKGITFNKALYNV
jgi:putative flippase GtrA